MLARKPLPEVVAAHVLDKIIKGEYPANTALPSELQITEELSVSRLTVREAIKVLTSGNVVKIRRGVGTFVNPPSEWSSFEALMALSLSFVDPDKAAKDLVEVRRMVETGAALLAATHRTDQDVESLEASIMDMETAFKSGDVAAFLEADSRFHDLILKASKNVFISLIFEPLKNFLLEGKKKTSSVPETALHGIQWHKIILEAVKAGDPEKARVAMSTHMDVVIADIHALFKEEQKNSKKAAKAI